MTITKTDYQLTVNASSSFIVYICKDAKTADTILKIEGIKGAQLKAGNGEWYYQVTGSSVNKICAVPAFFHDLPLQAVIVEHNNGSWDAKQTYSCYIVED